MAQSKPNKFVQDWLQNPEYQPWLAAVAGDPHHAFCKPCKRTLGAETTTLKRHKTSAKHKKMMEEMEGQEEEQERPSQQEEVLPSYIKTRVASAIILFACFIAEHNLPFLIADHAISLMKAMFPDSQIAKALSIHRTKCSEVVQILGNFFKENTVQQLRTNKFSIIIDETTDLSTTKSCTVIVRFYDSDTNLLETKFLDLIDVYEGENAGGSTGQNLFNMLVTTFERYRIPMNNLIGFAADGAANIFGTHNSVCSRLYSNFPGITAIKCVSHSIHLCCSDACKVLPRQTEDLIRNVYSFFSHSAKRVHEFKEFQVYCKVKPHKMLHACQTRWLSLHSAVKRMLEQWNPLSMYFDLKESEEKLTSISQVNIALKDPTMRLYFTFLDYILPLCTDFNKLSQRKSPVIHLLYDNTHRLYGTILSCFCLCEKVNSADLSTFDPTDAANHKPLKDIYLGAPVHNLLKDPKVSGNSILIHSFLEKCKSFYIVLCQQIKKRFNLENNLWRMASYLNPPKFLNPRSRESLPSFQEFVDMVPRIYDGNVQQLDNEWRSVDWYDLSDIKNTSEITIFYERLLTYEDSLGIKKFKTIAAFALTVLSLPTSNSDAERMFSKLSSIKNKKRNKLCVSTMSNLVTISEEVAKVGCMNYKPSTECLALFIS
ncbi:uncharacterized protein LOC143039686 [Oratosquilla oratoria]|uniref:uncharacterized protein LOC143039686 n=1 Tax=Oratosquilla oratoria TaxID=337810 RepID=UPI003F776531